LSLSLSSCSWCVNKLQPKLPITFVILLPLTFILSGAWFVYRLDLVW
jgi:hypothetical protein